MLSVIIPSRSGNYLQKTIDDLNKKARNEIEIIVALDGHVPQETLHGARVLSFSHIGMRACINKGMENSHGEFVMKCDEHCMFDEGFDVKLSENCSEDWVVTPRRQRLDADNWKFLDDPRPPVDYMYQAYINGVLRGWKDEARYHERKNILIDDTMTFQGSCWFLRRKYWKKLLEPLDDEHYGPFANEAQEITNKVWLSGGRVVVNKKTWYAHWYRDRNTYNFTKEEQKQFNEDAGKGHKYCADFWLNNKWDKRIHDYKWLVEKFNPPTKRAT